MTDEQLVAAWLRMLNGQRLQLNVASKLTYDLQLGGRQSIAHQAAYPLTREHLVARVEQLIQGQINDRLQGT